MEIKKITFGLIAFMVLIMATAVISEAATPMVAAGNGYIVGLKSDGTVVLAGPDLGNVDDWNLDVVDSGDDNDDGCFINGL